MDRVWVSGLPRLWVHRIGGDLQCAGCQEPLVERMVAEVVEELGIEGETIAISGVGCNTRMIVPLEMDGVAAAHGRAPDVATGIKRVLGPEAIVITLQGDGDCISIGAGSLINAAARAEKITIIMLNNATYGTTGGQMAPTSLLGQVTATTPQGRSPETGYPMHVPELLAHIQGVVYAARGAVHTPAHYRRTKRYLKDALEKQKDNLGLSFLEVLVACPPNWRLAPIESLKWIEEKLMPEFPLGVFKDVSGVE